MTAIAEEYTTATFAPTATRQSRGAKITTASFNGHLRKEEIHHRLKASGIKGNATIRHWRADNQIVREFVVRI